MKYIWIVAAALMMAACNSAPKQEQVQTDPKENPSAEWVEVVFEVEGMTCEGCENAIQAGVENLEGIRSVESSHEEGWTRVTYDSQATSPDEITRKITETGYEVKGEKPPEM